MNFKKLLIIPIVGVLSVMSIAAAAALNVDAGANQAGNDLVLTCDDDGVQVGFRNNWEGNPDNQYQTEEVTVSGIASACQGEIMKVTLTAQNGSYLASAGRRSPTTIHWSSTSPPRASLLRTCTACTSRSSSRTHRLRASSRPE